MTYIDYDELGVVEIRCMICGTPVSVRTTVTITTNSIPRKKEKVLVLKRLANYCQRKHALEDGSYIEIILCKDCINAPITTNKIEKDVENAWVKTWKHLNKTDKEIEKLKLTAKIKAIDGILKDKDLDSGGNLNRKRSKL